MHTHTVHVRAQRHWLLQLPCTSKFALRWRINNVLLGAYNQKCSQCLVCYTDLKSIFCCASHNTSILNIDYLNKALYYIRARADFIQTEWIDSPAYFRDTLMLPCKNKVPALITRSASPKNGADAAPDKGSIFSPSVPALCLLPICSNVGA